MIFSNKFLKLQAFFLFLAIGLGLLYWQQNKPQSRLPIIGSVGDFKLLSSDNQEVGLIDLKGKVWVADFMFTTCGNICPMMTKNMNVLHRSFRDSESLRLVSISVNPENDTPQMLSQYANKYRADTSKWYFLTGSREEITRLAVSSFKLGDIKEPIFHSPHFVLVDKNANIRAYYDGTDTKAVKKLAADLAQLLKEK